MAKGKAIRYPSGRQTVKIPLDSEGNPPDVGINYDNNQDKIIRMPKIRPEKTKREKRREREMAGEFDRNELNSVKIGGLKRETTVSQIEFIFKEYGEIKKVNMDFRGGET